MSESKDGNNTQIEAINLTLAYDEKIIVEKLSLCVKPSSFTVIIGPNACGKSTLLRSMAQLLKPRSGVIMLEGKNIASYRPKQTAKMMGILPQNPVAPEGISVLDLVSRGRYPHQGLIRQWNESDEKAVAEALLATGTQELANQQVDQLSGGQRQRVWVAMTLAQQTSTILLDEPTTFLDISHQYELMELFATMHKSGKTLVAVLHDLNQAARYATHLVAMKHGKIVVEGSPVEVITPENMLKVFGLKCQVIDDPQTGTPLVIPQAHPSVSIC